MRLRQSKELAGFTIIELLVVMALIAILTAITIPVLSSGGGIFGRDELKRTAQVIHSKIQAAQIYANTYRVKTAVVYSLDNWIDPVIPDGPVADPLVDSIFSDLSSGPPGVPLMRRAIVAAAVMYELPTELKAPLAGKFVPVPTEEGNFETFPGDHIILLMDTDPTAQTPLYDNLSLSRYVPRSTTPNLLNTLGMDEVVAITGDSDILREDILDNLGLEQLPATFTALENYVGKNQAVFPAHIFSRVGKMVPPFSAGARKERFIIHAAASPEADPNLRVLFPEGLSANNEFITIPIEIFRSTGRVRIGG